MLIFTLLGQQYLNYLIVIKNRCLSIVVNLKNQFFQPLSFSTVYRQYHVYTLKIEQDNLHL